MCESRTCVNCGRERKYYQRKDYPRLEGAKGMCNTCYMYWKKHHRLRPTDPKLRRRRVAHPHCVNCGKERKYCKHATRESIEGARGLCNACYQFWRLNGKMREKEDMRIPYKGLCTNCRQAMKWKGKLCVACQVYKQRHGKNRPRRLFREECSNCGVPFNDTKQFSGLCEPCRKYLNRTGNDKPERLWKSEHGWCECSTGKKPVKATHTVKMVVRKHVETVPMCDECYSIHMQHVRWYGDNTKNNARLPLSGDD